MPLNIRIQAAKSTHHPHKIDNQHRECKTGGGANFCLFLRFRQFAHHHPPKRSPDEEGLLWGWCVVRGSLRIHWNAGTACVSECVLKTPACRGLRVSALLRLRLADLGVVNLNFENAPTCYRAPKWPDPEFPRKIPKKYPPGRNSGTPRKYPQNAEKIPKMRIFGILGVFFGYFQGILGVNSGSPEFRAGGYFFGIFRGNSRSGHFGAL